MLSCSSIATCLTSQYIRTNRFLLVIHHSVFTSYHISHCSHFLPYLSLSGSFNVILFHSVCFCRAGYLPQSIPLQIICYLSEEDEFLPWHAASRALYQLDKLLDRTKDYSIFSVSEPPLALGKLYHWPDTSVFS